MSTYAAISLNLSRSSLECRAHGRLFSGLRTYVRPACIDCERLCESLGDDAWRRKEPQIAKTPLWSVWSASAGAGGVFTRRCPPHRFTPGNGARLFNGGSAPGGLRSRNVTRYDLLQAVSQYEATLGLSFLNHQ